ncbi:MAG TPA: EamA family transporter [Fimbriimonadaceae bacterium]|nr:EamA family transporter [Fimbriimonadaceae bacterium]
MPILILLLGLCGVASAALLARYGLAAGVSPAALSAWRLTVASAALIATAAILRLPRIARPDLWRVALAGVFLALHFSTWIASLEYVSVTRSTLLVATSPLWAGLLGLAVPSLRPRPIFWLGLAFAAAGTVLFTSQSSAAAPKGPPWMGDLLAIVGAIAIVPYLLLSQSVQKKTGTLMTVTGLYAAAALALWLYLLPAGQANIPHSTNAWGSIVGMAVFAQLLGHSSLNASLRHFSAAQVATATLLEPVFAACLAWIFLGERIGGLQVLGGGVLLAGVGLGLRSETEKGITPVIE